MISHATRPGSCSFALKRQLNAARKYSHRRRDRLRWQLTRASRPTIVKGPRHKSPDWRARHLEVLNCGLLSEVVGSSPPYHPDQPAVAIDTYPYGKTAIGPRNKSAELSPASARPRF